MTVNTPGVGDVDMADGSTRSAPVDRNGIVIEVGDTLLNVKTRKQYWVYKAYVLNKGHMIWCGMAEGAPLQDAWTDTFASDDMINFEVIADPRDFLKEIPI